MIQLIASCPSSCVVCSEDITLCQGLTYLLAAPASTKALIVTDGSITSVEGFNLSFLFNATLLRLSSNGIATIRDDAFLGLRTLKTLLLDQNQISSSSITYSTFHELQTVQVLVLSNNVLNSIHGTWFRNMKDLIRLQLNGNQLTSITRDSFEMANLGNLRTLDLSNNFISSIEKKAFQGLTQLVEINLSRNRLALIPDTFSPLTQLSLLSLDQNWWNCTCKLYDLASFLRNYMNSSSRTLRNADNMSCRASENPTVINLLDLTEVNCKSALKHPPGNLKNKRKKYGRDIALVAVFSFLGGVGLTCLVLVLLNRKLQHSKANELSSENCCCRTLDESQCGHEPRNYLTKGYCNCHLTRENEIKVMSMLGSGREMPLLQENSHQETVKAESKCTGPKMPLRSIQKENEPVKNDHFLCLNCRLLQSYPQESSGNMAVPNEADVLHQKHFHRRVRSPENFGQWEEDSQTAGLEDHSKFSPGIRSDIFCGRCARPACVMAKGRLRKQLANESRRSLSKREDDDCVKSYRQRQFISALSSAPNTPEESKEHCVQATSESQRVQQDDQCGSLERRKNISPPLDNFLICKYIDSDKYQDYSTEKKHNHSKNLKLEKEQSAMKSKQTRDCRMSDDEMPLSPSVKRTYQPKSVSFYVPDLETVKRVDVTTSGLSEVRSPKNRRLHECIQGNLSSALAKRLLGDSEAKSRVKKTSPTIAGPEEKGETELISKCKIKAKRQDSLTVKLNLHPFRKVRVHPEERLPEENTEPHPCCQPKNTLTELQQTMPQASKKETVRRTRKTKSEFSVIAQETLEGSSEVINSRPVEEKEPEQNGNKAVTCKSCPSKRITEDLTPTKHLQTPGCTSSCPSYLIDGTSKMTISILAPTSENSQSISQNTANYIPISMNSKELKEHATETPVLALHRDSLMTEVQGQDHNPPPAIFIQRENNESISPKNEDHLQLQQITESTAQSMNLDQLENQKQRRQDENQTMKDGLEDYERAGEFEAVEGNLDSTQPRSFDKIPFSLSNAHRHSEEVNTDQTKSPVHLSDSLFNSQANEHLATKEGLEMPDGLRITEGIEDYGTKTQQEREDEKTESNRELTKMFIPDLTDNSVNVKEEETQTGDEWENNKFKTFPKSLVKVTIISNTSSVPSSPETENTHLDGNINLETNTNVHVDNESDLQEALNHQLDEGSSKHKEGKMPLEIHKDPSLLRELKDTNYEEQTEMPLIPCSTNKAEISVPKSAGSPSCADYDKELPLQVEQSKENVLVNSYPSLAFFVDKKPYSI
ncbi:leucine-rich repeat-containing protein 53 [Tiliqua scincoides]|uniref:leucine-rich repeat-containing protein 53 n=1 Tax=Tiliqua scincoides TaxID=71010 RepID=UPI0034636447